LHPRVIATINAATTHRLAVFLDTLFRQPGRSTGSAADIVDRLVHRCRGARLVLLHGGGPEVLRIAEIVRLHPTLLLDVSYTLLAYRHSSVTADLRCIFERLDQRVVVGSDMPEFTPAEAFAEAQRLAAGLPPEKWLNIASQNLMRLFAGR
jgi:predicted TIM-barrel fold metal-dependent hydrolase